MRIGKYKISIKKIKTLKDRQKELSKKSKAFLKHIWKSRLFEKAIGVIIIVAIVGSVLLPVILPIL